MPRIKTDLCVFCCERKTDSGEHLYAQWLRDYVPHWSKERTQQTSVLDEAPYTVTKAGAVNSQQLRIVCQQCNGGWMSGIQSSAKPVLVPALKGFWPLTDEKSYQALAAWAALFTIVAEYKHKASMGITQEERTRFKGSNGAITEHWNLAVGWYSGSENAAYSHVNVDLALVGDMTLSRIQVTTFLVGNLIFLTTWSPENLRSFMREAFTEVCCEYDLFDFGTIVAGRLPPKRIHNDSTANQISKAVLPDEVRGKVRNMVSSPLPQLPPTLVTDPLRARIAIILMGGDF